MKAIEEDRVRAFFDTRAAKGFYPLTPLSCRQNHDALRHLKPFSYFHLDSADIRDFVLTSCYRSTPRFSTPLKIFRFTGTVSPSDPTGFPKNSDFTKERKRERIQHGFV